MIARPLGALALTAALALGLAACGGGGSTTIIETTGTPTTSSTATTTTTTAPPPTSTTAPSGVFMSDPLGKSSSEPATFAFSADGDLVGHGLQWSNWGSPTATATGTLIERKSGSIQTVSFPGSVAVSGLTECKGAQYYTHAKATVPASAPFQPTTIPLGSPCQ